MPLKINYKNILFYAAYGAAVTFINFALPSVPLSLGLCFAMLGCGANIIATPAIFIIASATDLNLTLSMLALAEGAFLTIVVFLYRRTERKIGFEAIIYFVIALAPHVIFAPWLGFETDINPYVIKGVAAVAAGLFTVVAYRCVYTLLYRLGRCRPREDELVCCAVVAIVVLAGIVTVAGEGFYLALSGFLIAFSVRLARSPSALIAAIVYALPYSVVCLDAEPLTAYVIICSVALLFSATGRAGVCGAVGAVTAAYEYLRGCFFAGVPIIVANAILLFFGCLVAALPSDETLKRLKRRIVCEDILSDAAAERGRRRTGERLFRISELFREIECAFMALDEDVDEGRLKEQILIQLKEKCCKNCERVKKCERTNVYSGFRRLIDAGCMKGKVNLIDLPADMTAVCANPSDVLAQLNIILSEYRRIMTESENARAGRKMLADQAKGVSEVMKDCAVELSRTLKDYSELEKEVKKSLAVRGISCPEVKIEGDFEDIVSLMVCGKCNINIILKELSDKLQRAYVLKEKLAYDGQKNCLVFTAAPKMDAAFGVAYAIKKGEKVSGDTHSVIRINEHAFLMALSDGMGSGEYARRISEAAISLIEAFYRAEMPEDTVLKTINKLLSFNRDERFTCIDIAAVNLDSGRADFIKIGSPAGIIMREGEIRVIESQSLPLGILDNLRPTTRTEELQCGDIVIFMSDGVSGAFPSSTDLYEFLRNFRPLNPQNLADKILSGALERVKGAPQDDMTVLCTRLFEFKG